MNISTRFTDFYPEEKILIYFSSQIFIDKKIIINLSFFNSLNVGLRATDFLQLFVDI